VVSLNGTWQFHLDAGPQADWNVNPGALEFPDRIQVPGCWDAQGFGKPTDRMRHHGIGVGWYRRTFALPADWGGKRVWLRVGGAHRSVRGWVDGQPVGEHWGYPTACRWEVTKALTAGAEHVLILAVDSRRHWERDTLTGSFDMIDYMDIDWGGIFDDVTLEATGEVWIDDAFVVPEPARHRALVRLQLGGTRAAGLSLRYEVRQWSPTSDTHPPLAQGETTVQGVEPTLTLNLPGAPLWSPESPNLLALRVRLFSADRVLDEQTFRFGLRRLEIRGNDFYLNGRRFLLRGYGDDCTLPRELVPPADRDYWRRYLSLRREFGFNGVRHHSMMPPEAYLSAADEVGMFVQPELPIAYQPFFDRSTDAGKDLYRQVWRDYIRQMRNHPSVFAWCMGNELWNGFPLGPELYDTAKKLDPTRPVIDTDGIPVTERPTLDYLSIQFDENSIPWGARRGKYRLAKPAPKPVLVHEMSNLCTLPDPTTIGLYSGPILAFWPQTMRDRYACPVIPFWLQTMRDRVTERRLSGLLPAMLDASHRLQARLLQLNVEAARLSPEIDGYHQWLFRDYWTQSSGFVDQFDALRRVTPEFARRFNGPAVLLLDAESVSFRSGEAIPVRLYVSDFREQTDAPWDKVTVRCGGTKVRLTPPDDRTGPGLLGPWTGTVVAPTVKAPTRPRLTAMAGEIRNEWPVWIFPPTPIEVTDAHRKLIIGQLSAAALREVEQGAARLLVNVEGLLPALPTTFKPSWWKGGNDTDHSYGHLLLPHPALGAYPHRGYADLDMYSLIEGRSVVLVDDVPGRPEPILWDLDVPWLMRRKAFLFEARVGAGKLLVSTLNLSRANRAADPAAAWLFRQLLAYVRSDGFRPAAELPADWLRQRLQQVELPDPATFVNGFGRLVEATEPGQTWHSYRENDTPSLAVRQTDGRQRLTWETAPLPKDWPHDTVTFVWTGGIGWRTEPEGGHFTLALSGKPLLDFPFTQQTSHWKSDDGTARFHYLVKRMLGPDSFGVFYLTVPRDRVAPGRAAQITAAATAQNSRRWLGLNPYTDTLEYEAGY
jgi:hypothetical protein